MKRPEVVETFYTSIHQHILFLVTKTIDVRFSRTRQCMAVLQKHKDLYFYSLYWRKKDGEILWLGEYLRPFECSPENIAIFNNGTQKMAVLLREYIETNDFDLIAHAPNPFGGLAPEGRPILEPPPDPYPFIESED